MTEHALEIRGLRKVYRGFTLDNVSFTLPRGRVMGLIGPNGAGKTTIVKLIMNLVSRQAGEIKVFGLDNRRDEVAVRSRIGFVYDVPPFVGDTTAERHRRALARFYPAWSEATFERLARSFDLPLDKKIKALSHGMRTKLALALALSHDADLLVLDEPTSGVDPASRRRFWDMIGDLAEQGITVFVTTHFMDEAEHCDELALIYGGRIVAAGSPAHLKREHVSQALLELECADLMGAYAALKHEAAITGVALFGNALHLTAVDEAAARDAAVASLGRAGIALSRLERIEPSLEDAFVAIIQESKGGEP